MSEAKSPLGCHCGPQDHCIYGSLLPHAECKIAVYDSIRAKLAELSSRNIVLGESNLDLIAREAQASHERNELRAKLAEREAALAKMREIVTQSNMQCNHPSEAEDLTPEDAVYIGLCSGDDCIYCALLHVTDDGREASQ